MKYLFNDLPRIKRLLNGKFVFLLLDYDGTLTPIVNTPSEAVMHKGIKELLQRLSRSPYCGLGIISGRPLSELKKAVGIKGIIYAGNHGLEICGPKIKFTSADALRLRPVMRSIAMDLRKRVSGIKGVLVENKGLTLSVHYRLVDKENYPLLKRILFQAIGPYAARNKIKVDFGKKVYEIKPQVNWGKGEAVLRILKRQQFTGAEKAALPVYIGDDSTDEDAFRALKGKGLTVFVGKPGNSAAGYYLNSTEEVNSFLRFILRLRHN